MSPDQSAKEALDIAQELETTVDQILEKINKGFKYNRRTRTLLWIVAGLGAISLGLGVTVGVLFAELHANQIQSCLNGNESRTANRQLWDHILQLSSRPQPGESPSQIRHEHQQATAFRVYVHTKFAPVDCKRLYG